MTMRVEKKYEVGDPGAVYEFNIKLPLMRGVDCTDKEFSEAARESIEIFVRQLKQRYTWIGRVYQTGRSAGWLAIEDKKGLATEAKLKTIQKMVNRALDQFVRYMEEAYPR